MNRITLWIRIGLYLVGGTVSLTGPLFAAQIFVGAGEDFQAALMQARPGDTIVLQAGATFSTAGGFKLLNKGTSTEWITIQSSALDALPGAGYRVHPSDAANMPKLISTVNGAPVIYTESGAHHYQLIGLEFALANDVWAYDMVRWGTGIEPELDLLPHHLAIHRCYVHADPIAGTKRGVYLNGADLSIVDSYISEIHAEGQDSMAIGGRTGPGRFQVINNYIEGAGENIIFGGADPVLQDSVMEDIEIRNNYIHKPLSWMVDHPTYAGKHWTVKNLLELKNTRRVVIDGNILENCWLDAQDGFGVLFTVRNQDGKAPWAVVEDVSFTRNIIRNVGSGVAITAEDDAQPSQITQRILIRDVLLENVNATVFKGSGLMFQITSPRRPGQDLAIDHVTAIHAGAGNSYASVGDAVVTFDRFSFNNSIVTHATYGFIGAGTAEGTASLDRFFTNWTHARNAIIGPNLAAYYPPDNSFPVDQAAMGFRDLNALDYRLADNSPYKNAGTDGKDLGADMETLMALTCGVKQGIPSSACSSIPTDPPVARCDLNRDTLANINDIQLSVNQAIGVTACSTGDLNGDSLCNVADVQRIVNAVLGGPCIAS